MCDHFVLKMYCWISRSEHEFKNRDLALFVVPVAFQDVALGIKKDTSDFWPAANVEQ